MGNKKKNLAMLWISGTALAAMIVVVTIAFFNMDDMVTNVFKTENVNILLVEENYPGNTNSEVNNMQPYSDIDKNPSIINNGSAPVYVFLKVTVPVRTFQEISANGNVTPNTTTSEIFKISYSDGTTFNTENWLELPDKETGTAYDKDTRTYIFAYKRILDVGVQTEELFSQVQLKHILGGISGGDSVGIKIEAYAIQSENLSISISEENLTAETFGQIYDLAVK